MIAADLAEELGVAPQQVVAAAKAAGLAVVWSGSELSDHDVAVLRAELATAGVGAGATAIAPVPPAPATVRAASEPGGPRNAAAPSVPEVPVEPTAPFARPAVSADPAPAALAVPPNVVTSLEDEVVDALAPAAGVAPSPGVAVPPEGHEASDGRRGPLGPSEVRGADPSTGPPERPPRTPVAPRFDRSLRAAVAALAVAVLALLVAEVVVAAARWAAAVLVLVSLVAVVAEVVAANRARYHIQTHPDRERGLAAALVLLVVGALGLAALGLAGWAVFAHDRATSGPAGVLDRQHLVRELRWGRQRLWLVADNGWTRPAKSPGTCWDEPEPGEPERSRQADEPGRVEAGGVRVPCTRSHRYEVLAQVSLGSEADATYPGVAAVTAAAEARCKPILDAALLARAGRGKVTGPDYELTVDVPREANWERADHDAACLATIVGPMQAGTLR